MAGKLALDLSSNTGWAHSVHPDERPSFGTWECGSWAENPGLLLYGLYGEMLDAIALHAPDEVWVEAPLHLRAQTHHDSAIQQFELEGIARLVCEIRSVPMRTANVDTVRSRVLGQARFGSKEGAKIAVVQWCSRRGWPILDHNAADAAVLLTYAHQARRYPLRRAA